MTNRIVGNPSSKQAKARNKAKIIHKVEYNPFEGLTEADFLLTPAQYQRRFTIPLADTKEAKVMVEAQLINPYTGKVELLETASELQTYSKKLVETAASVKSTLKEAKVLAINGDPRAAADLTRRKFKSLKLKEASIDSFSYDLTNDLNLSGTYTNNNEFTPLMAGVFSKQQYLFDYLRMHSKAFEEKNHNPLAANIIRLTTEFALGKGVHWNIHDPIVKKIWEDHWKYNDLAMRLFAMSDDFSWQGELMVRYQPVLDPATLKYSNLKVVMMDPSTVWEVVTDPEDITDVKFYHRQFSTQYQILSDKIPTIKYIVEQVPAAEVYHIKNNVSSYEKRGRSDLFSVLGWLKMFKDLNQAAAVNAQMMNNFVFKVTVRGDQADVDRFLADPVNKQIPTPGSMFVANIGDDGNPNVDLVGLASGVNTGTMSEDAKQIASIIAAAVGLPAEYINQAGAASRATAFVHSEPAVKKIQKRQLQIEAVLNDMFQRVMRQSVKEGLLSSDADFSHEFIFPEIVGEDRSAKLQDLVLCEDRGYFSKERVANMVAKEFNVTNYDYKEETQQATPMGGAPAVLGGGKTQSALGAPAGAQKPASGGGSGAPVAVSGSPSGNSPAEARQATVSQVGRPQ